MDALLNAEISLASKFSFFWAHQEMPDIEKFIAEITKFFMNIPDSHDYRTKLQELLSRDSIKVFVSHPSFQPFFDCAMVVLKKYHEACEMAYMAPMPGSAEALKLEDQKSNREDSTLESWNDNWECKRAHELNHCEQESNFLPSGKKSQQDQLPSTTQSTRVRKSGEPDMGCCLVM